MFVLDEREPEAAARKRTGNVAKSAPAPPEVFDFPQAYVPVPGEPPWRPCTSKGTGGHGPSNPLPFADWIRCTYQCGRYQVRFYIFGRKAEECREQKNAERAEKFAKDHHG